MSRVLLDFRCPIHRCELVIWFDADEHGPTQHFQCPIGDEVFRAQPDGAGDFVPIDDEADD